MCWQCDHPDKTIDDYYDLVQGIIDRFGWFIQFVERNRHHPPFAYTVGLTPRGIPELVVTGLSQHRTANVLNAMAHELVWHNTDPLRSGEWRPLPGDTLVEVVDMPEPTAHLFTAVDFYGPAIRAQQLVWADDHAHWPWQLGFRGRQPVLGPRDASRV